MATADKVLSVLGLFSIDRPEWTVDAVATALGLSSSTAYQYVGSLVGAGLLIPNKGARYTVGPAVIELDRLMRRHDPFIHEAQEGLREIAAAIDGDAIALLCRIYRLRVMCVDQYAAHAPGFAISYERGRPMPLARGSASKVILAHLAPRALRRFYDSDSAMIESAGLGSTWDAFKLEMRRIRKVGVLVSTGELDVGMMGISAPVFAGDGDVLGSIGLVLPATILMGDAVALEAARRAVAEAGTQVSRALG